MDALPVFRALGDPTRYKIYRAIAESGEPCSTTQLAAELDLHPNTVRPHLERLREAGLLQVERDSQGTVGRPQHRYEVTPGAPSLEPDVEARRLLTDLLAEMVSEGGVATETIKEVGRRYGRSRHDAARSGPRGCVEVLDSELARLGFDPLADWDATGEKGAEGREAAAGQKAATGGQDAAAGGSVTVSFSRCPFRELAEARPELVCELHRGLVEGLVGTVADVRIRRFATLEDRDPCRVELAVG